MPMLWRRVAWFASFAAAVALALFMRSVDFGWSVVLVAALVTWIVLSLVISQLCAVFVLGRINSHLRRTDGLANKIADAVRGLPPEEQEAVAKRMIDETLK